MAKSWDRLMDMSGGHGATGLLRVISGEVVQRTSLVIGTPSTPVLESRRTSRQAAAVVGTSYSRAMRPACQLARWGAFIAPRSISTRFSTKRSSDNTLAPTALVKLASPVGGRPTNEHDADLLPRDPEILRDSRAALAQEFPCRVTCGQLQEITDLGIDPVDRAGELRTNLQVCSLTPASLGEFGDWPHDRFRGRASVASRSSTSLLEQYGTSFCQLRDVSSQDGSEHLVATSEVIVDGRRIPLAGRSNDFRNRDVVDAAFGEKASGSVEEEFPCRRQLIHGETRVAGALFASSPEPATAPMERAGIG